MENKPLQIACGALIIKDKRILLAKRSNYTPAFPGYWGFPGGRAEKGETLEQAVIREVKEEVGLSFQPTKLFSKGQWQDRLLHRFLGEHSGEIKLQPEELTDFNWFTFEEALKLDLAFECQDVITKLHEAKIL